MKTFTSRLRQFAKSDDGISSVEYALLLAFVGGGVILGANYLGASVGEALTAAGNCVNGGTGCDAALSGDLTGND